MMKKSAAQIKCNFWDDMVICYSALSMMDNFMLFDKYIFTHIQHGVG